MNKIRIFRGRYDFIALVFSWLIMGSVSTLYGQNNEVPTIPYNGSYLYKYGISPAVFNLLLSPMYQEEFTFSADWTLSEEYLKQATQVTLQMDYDPYYEFGNQLFVIVRDKNTYTYW